MPGLQSALAQRLGQETQAAPVAPTAGTPTAGAVPPQQDAATLGAGQFIEQANQLLEQAIETGAPIDPNSLAVPLQRLSQNIAVLAARDGGQQQQGAQPPAQLDAAQQGVPAQPGV